METFEENFVEGANAEPENLILMSYAEAGKLLGVSHNTIRRRVREGWFESTICNGRTYVYLPTYILRQGLLKCTPGKKSSPWTQTKIKQKIRNLFYAGIPMTWECVEQSCPGLYQAACSTAGFGSWQAALAATGIEAAALPA